MSRSVSNIISIVERHTLLGDITATASEINQACDQSAAHQSITAAGALTLNAKSHGLAVASGGAVTLAAPTANEYGLVKVITMTTDDGDVTLALTNVVGGSAASTATFDAVGETLTLVGSAQGKWVVLDEHGVTLS